MGTGNTATQGARSFYHVCQARLFGRLVPLLVPLVGAFGCDSITQLKARLHTAPGVAGQTDPIAPGQSGLDVVVSPPTGMTVLIDGTPFSHTSPACHRSLEPGTHTVYVRAMGYHAITLPVTLTEGQTLRLPVALRPRTPTPFSGPVAEVGSTGLRPQAAGGAPSGQPERNRPRPQPPAGVPASHAGKAAALLPEGTAGVTLHMVAQPSAPIVVDNDATDGRSVRLHRAQGTLAVGAMVVTYTVAPGRMVDFLVPTDGCLWYRDGTQIKAGSLVHLGRGLLRLRRVAPGAQEQAVVLRRLG